MPNLLDIRRRIKSVKNTQQITKAMKMVSAAKLKRAQDRVVSARPFANKMTEVLGDWRRAQMKSFIIHCWIRVAMSDICWCWSLPTKDCAALSIQT